MKYPRLLSAAFAAFILCLVSRQASAQILQNGGFENPRITSGTTTTTVPTYWTDSSDVLVSNGNGTLGNTPYGTQFVELLPTDTLSQSVTGFVAGQVYVLGFDFAFESGTEADPLTVSLTGADVTSSSYTLTGTGSYGSGTIPFQSTAIIFTPTTSGSIKFSFSDLGAAVAVDNVGLYGNIVTPQPPPSLRPTRKWSSASLRWRDLA